MQYQEIRDALHRHFSKLLAERDRTMQANGPLGPEAVASLKHGRDLAAEAIEGRNTLSLVSDDTELLARFIAEYELPIQADGREHSLLKGEFYKAYRDYCHTVLDRNQELTRYDYQSPAEPRPQDKKAGSKAISLRETVQKFITEEIRVGSWGKRTEDQNRQHIDFLQSRLGAETNVRDITTEDAVRVRDTLLKLPPNMNKNPKTRGKSLEDVLAMDHASKLNVRTVNMYLKTYSKLFGWTKRTKLTDDNPFADLLLTENKRNTGKRLAFTPEQIQQIEAALLTEDPEYRPTKEAHRWASLIAVYTGARLNEVCQLTVDDVQEHDGIWCFDFNEDGEGKHLKNNASARKVPVHSRLIELGMLEYVTGLKDKQAPKLFPEYTYTRNYGWGKNLSVWFNNILLKRLGMKNKSLVLHSLRHTMSTKLQREDVPLPIVSGLLGHARKGVTQQSYFAAGYKIQQLKDAIEKF